MQRAQILHEGLALPRDDTLPEDIAAAAAVVVARDVTALGTIKLAAAGEAQGGNSIDFKNRPKNNPKLGATKIGPKRMGWGQFLG